MSATDTGVVIPASCRQRSVKRAGSHVLLEIRVTMVWVAGAVLVGAGFLKPISFLDQLYFSGFVEVDSIAVLVHGVFEVCLGIWLCVAARTIWAANLAWIVFSLLACAAGVFALAGYNCNCAGTLRLSSMMMFVLDCLLASSIFVLWYLSDRVTERVSAQSIRFSAVAGSVSWVATVFAFHFILTTGNGDLVGMSPVRFSSVIMHDPDNESDSQAYGSMQARNIGPSPVAVVFLSGGCAMRVQRNTPFTLEPWESVLCKVNVHPTVSKGGVAWLDLKTSSGIMLRQWPPMSVAIRSEPIP